MSDDLWSWLIDRIGQLIPCELCGSPTPSGDLTECKVPGFYITEWDMVVHRVVFLCQNCPVLL